MNYLKLEADESEIDIASQTRLTIGQVLEEQRRRAGAVTQ